MADKRDYYEALGVEKNAADDEIKKAFRKQAKKFHPDVNPGNKEAETRFKEINEAYEVLSDSDKKAKYDRFGHAGVDPNFQQGDGFGGFGGFGGMDIDLSDIFGSIFGGGGSARTRSKTAPRKGERIRETITLTFEEACFGCEKEITVSRIENCSDCRGSGSAPGTTAEKCANCSGSGVVTTQQRTAFGVMQSTAECPKCSGKGKIIHQPCTKCRGHGMIRRNKTVKVNIPAGIDDSQTISLRGQGHAGVNGGEAGELFVTVIVARHELFNRDGTSIHLDLHISFVQAALGAELEVPTVDGKVKYRIPEGTQTGSVFRLKGKGVPSLRGGSRGDQFVTVNVVVPTDLTAKQKELLRQFESPQNSETDEAEPESDTSFFGRKKRKSK